jgi:hypothetical protein
MHEIFTNHTKNIGVHRVDLSLVSTHKLHTKTNTVLNIYKIEQKLHALALAYRLFKRFPKVGRGSKQGTGRSVT